jgi:sugar lactone lactonase YvrE
MIIPAASSFESIGVLTQGAEDLDFKMAPDSTCKTGKHAEVSKCVVNVTFTPTAPGLRMGAVVLFSGPHNTGRQVVIELISGNGTGPQVAFSTGPLKWSSPKVDGKTLNSPMGLAMNGAGDLFIADSGNDRVVEVPAGGAAPIAIDPAVSGESLNDPQGVAVDGAGDLFILHANQTTTEARLFKVPSGGGPAISLDLVANGVQVGEDLGEGIDASGLAVDGAGNLFIADWDNSRIVKIPAGGGAAVALAWTVDGLQVSPQSVAVDAAGDLIIGDFDGPHSGGGGASGRIVEVPGNGGAPFAIPLEDGLQLLFLPQITVDAAGDIYAPAYAEEPPPYAAVSVIPVNGRAPYDIDLSDIPSADLDLVLSANGLVLDREGNLFMAEGFGNIIELQQSKAQQVDFPTPTAVGTFDTIDPIQTIAIQNIGNKNLDLSHLGFPADFSSFGGGPGACTGETDVEPGNACNISVGFTPKHVGILKEFVTLKDNNLHKSDARQQIPVEGKGIQ